MWDISNEFDNYKVKCCSRSQYWNSSYNYRATITLYKGSQHVGTLYFRRESSTAKDRWYSTGRSSPKVVVLEYFEQDFDRVLALLQQETPLYVCIRGDNMGALTTTMEPVGEEES